MDKMDFIIILCIVLVVLNLFNYFVIIPTLLDNQKFTLETIKKLINKKQ